jgi:hypothetical protein
MNKAVSVASQEIQYKALAHSHLLEARRILRQLAADRRREERRRVERPNILAEIKAILQHA